MDDNFPAISPVKTGKNIVRLRKERGLTVKDIQEFFNFEAPQAIYKWQSGQSLPNIDNLFALAYLFKVPVDKILVPEDEKSYRERISGQQASSCCPVGFLYDRQTGSPSRLLPQVFPAVKRFSLKSRIRIW